MMPSAVRRAVLLLLAGLALSQSGCGSQPGPEGPSVLLVVVDTLRADHLGAYGSQRAGISPALDRFSRQARVYERAMSPAPFTMPAMAATLTGVYPDRAGVVNHSAQDTLRNFPGPTLAEIMRAAGYETGAVVTNGWLKRDGQGYDRGFDTYVTRPGDRGDAGGPDGAAAVTDRVLDLVGDAGERPFLIWAHYMEPHMPYQPRSDDAAWFGVASGSSAVVGDFIDGDFDVKQRIYFEGDYPSFELEATRNLYAGEVRTVDREIGRLFEALDKLGRTDDTIVVVLSDHGESLGDHGLFFAHDFNLYDELLHVPLMVRRPGVEPGRIDSPVSLTDVLPSLCRWLALDCPAELDGRPLPEPDEPAGNDRNLFAASAPWRQRYARYPRHHIAGLEGRWTAVRRGDLKLIRIPHPEGSRWEAYDLAADPAELVNVIETADAGSIESMREALLEWERLMSIARPEPGGAVRKLDEKTLRELRALGYVG